MCNNCYNNCLGSISPDGCIQYTGPDVPELGICQGDTLYSVEQAILVKLVSLLSGSNLSFPTLAITCPSLTSLINSSMGLSTILQAYADAICSLNSTVTTLGGQVNPSSSFNVGCLTLTTATPTRDQVLQAALNKICDLNLRVNIIEGDYVKTEELSTLVNQIITAQTLTQEYVKMSKFIAYPFFGSLSVFDSQGKGLASMGYDKIYICNGQAVNGFTLPDTRGYALVGANLNVPGAALDSAVDPGLAANAGYGISQGTKKGELSHTSSIQEMPSHTHSLTDPGHTHTSSVKSQDTEGGGRFGYIPNNNGDGDHSYSSKTDFSVTGITNQATGNGQPHNNLQPSLGTIYIMFVP